eukprot:766251-Hanusia_phi.AAC.1
MLSCYLASSSSDSAQLFLDFNGVRFTDQKLVIGFVNDQTFTINPSSGPVKGGTAITIIPQYALSSNFLRFCVLNNQLISISNVHSEFQCVSRFSFYTGITNLKICNQRNSCWQYPYEFLPETEVLGVNPSFGILKQSSLVTIWGRHLDVKGIKIYVNSQNFSKCSLTIMTSSKLLCLIPPRPAIVGTKISIFSADMVELYSFNFKYEHPSRLERVFPTVFQSAKSSVVTVHGDHFKNSKDLQCIFGFDQTNRAFFISSTRLTCLVQPKIQGCTSLRIQNFFFDTNMDVKQICFGLELKIVEAQPTRGCLTGGTIVKVLLSNSLVDSSGIFCHFGSMISQASLLIGSLVQCIAPSLIQESEVDLKLSKHLIYLDGHVKFEYIRTPRIFELIPSWSTSSGGSIVQVTGSHFTKNDLEITLGNVLLSSEDAFFLTSTSIKILVPRSNGTLGKTFFQIHTRLCNGSQEIKNFLYVPEFHLNWMIPSISDGHGHMVTVVGQNFDMNVDYWCKFGVSLPTLSRILSSTALICHFPRMPENTFVRMELGPASQFVSRKHLWIKVTASELSVDIFPSFGPTKGGTLIHLVFPKRKFSLNSIHGTCDFEEHVSPIRLINNKPVCASPPGMITTQKRVTVLLSKFNIRLKPTNPFLYYNDPEIISIYPSVLSNKKSQILSIHGTGFRQGGIVCGFGKGLSIAPGRWQSSSVVLCFTIPSNHTKTSTLEISLNGGYDFSDSGAEILYEDGVALTGVTPARVISDEPNQVVTIAGYHFKPGGRHICHFGRSAETRAVYLTSSSLVCSVPRSKPGTVLLTITQEGLKSDAGIWFVYEQYQLALLSPSIGSSLGGTEVT